MKVKAVKEIVSEGTAHKVLADLKNALITNRAALTIWEDLTPLARNEWVCWVVSVKKEDTRKEHVNRVIIELKQGMRRPCCWMGCIHRTDKPLSPSVRGILDKRTKKSN